MPGKKAAWLTRLLSDATVFVFIKYKHSVELFKVCVLVTVQYTGVAFPKSFPVPLNF